MNLDTWVLSWKQEWLLGSIIINNWLIIISQVYTPVFQVTILCFQINNCVSKLSFQVNYYLEKWDENYELDTDPSLIMDNC